MLHKFFEDAKRNWSDSQMFSEYGPQSQEEAESWEYRYLNDKQRAVVFFVQGYFYTLRMSMICRKGHDYVETDGNPESGSFTVECRRCGHVIHGYW